MKRTLNNIFDACFLIVAIMIFEAAFCRMILQSFFAGLLVIPIAFLFLYICGKRTDLIKKIDCKKAWWILRVLSLALMIIVAFSLEVNLSWDWGGLIKSSYNYIQNGSIDIPDYYARYPNNQFWLLCLVTLFKFVRLFVGGASVTVYKRVTMIISIICVQIAIEFIYRTARMIFSEKKAFFAGLLALFCLPLYLYSGFFYTDIPSVLLVSIMLFLYFKLQQTENRKEQIIICALVGFVGAITYFLKLTAFIVFVAMIIGIIFTKITFKQFLSFFLVSVMALGVTVAAIKAVSEPIYKNKFGITEEMKDKYEFPPTHWIMMGLGFGGFSQEDIDRTKSFDTYEERENFNKREIKSRIENYGFLGLVNHLFSDKVIRTFGSCTLAGGDYVGRKPFHKNGIFTRLFSLHGDLRPIGLTFSWIYYIFITLGILFSAIGSLRKKKMPTNQKLLAGRISIFAIFFFMLIWECNSRYLLAFYPVMILLAADGLSHFVNTFKKCIKLHRTN